MKKQQSVLCMSPAGNGIALLALRSDQGRISIKCSERIELSLNILNDEPELISKKLQDELTRLGIRDRDVVFLAPCSWLISVRVDTQDVPDEDVESFIALQAERKFCYPVEELAVLRSRFSIPGDGRGALLVAMNRDRIERIHDILRGAKLHLKQIVPAIASLPCAPGNDARLQINLHVRRSGVDMAARCGNGLVALRRVAETQNIQPAIDPDLALDTAREIRLLQAQFSRESDVVIHSQGAAQGFIEELGRRLEADAEVRRAEPVSELEEQAGSPSLLAAALQYFDGKQELDFASCRQQSRLQQLHQRFGRAGLVAAAAAAVLIVLTLGAVLYQRHKLQKLREEYSAIHPKARQMNEIRDEVKYLSPWFRRRPRNLELMLTLTEAFPQSGDVWATRIEIRDSKQIFVSGKAKSERVWLAMQNRLHKSKSVRDLHILKLRTGKKRQDPLTFSLSFYSPLGAR